MEKTDSERLRDIDRNVQEMRTELFGIQGDNGFVGETKADLKLFGQRITSIERYMYMLMGAITIVGFFIAQHLLSMPSGK